ncbi:hypothetical protein [Trinickia soli]|uniref:Cro/Cl family transcriptional regulator n=1 Tax=Trinickia soli TaxID=380675 RepID=A0A2N7VQ84_9BURK|nr:hypothetical protein [Trinickia soli]PMS19275.1 hypothetical protein C0Z19_21835 [Trinickia soli]CAB3644223.1 hypothetical protein LMG24076_00471 [Trinickia soli]
MTLTKQQAILIFGNQSEIARALGLTRGAVSLWPDQLRQDQSDRVVGAAVRLGKRDLLPPEFAGSNPEPESQAA